jgi:hypothetical protein
MLSRLVLMCTYPLKDPALAVDMRRVMISRSAPGAMVHMAAVASDWGDIFCWDADAGADCDADTDADAGADCGAVSSVDDDPDSGAPCRLRKSSVVNTSRICNGSSNGLWMSMGWSKGSAPAVSRVPRNGFRLYGFFTERPTTRYSNIPRDVSMVNREDTMLSA